VNDTVLGAPRVAASQGGSSAIERVEVVATEVVAPLAAEVDREGRFPRESIDALRAAGLLSCAVPVHLGGEGLALSEVGAVAERLGRACASTAMIFAMHQIQVFSLVRHGRSATVEALLREVVADQLLLASATTEIGIGGDTRSSTCFVERDGDTVRLHKNAPVISYGDHCDAVLATARRDADAPPSDQVLVVCRRADTVLERTGTWDTLGFRGTDSPGFLLTATGRADMVLEDDYAVISAKTMLPVSHVLWSHLWLGIASDAVATARRAVQKSARSKPGSVPTSATRLAEVLGLQQQFRDLVRAAAARFDAAALDDEVLTSIGFSLAMNNLKVTTSGLVVDVVGQALLVAGIAGYREDGPFRLGRHLRDAHGAALMVNNDRIMANNAQLALVHRGAP
jgi:acyl-CoA dehydrogenase